MYFSFRQSLLRISGLLLVLLSTAGCSGALPFGTSSTPTNSMTLNVGQLNDGINFFPFYVAEQMGFFKAQGVILGKRPRIATGPMMVTALENGTIDIGGGVITDAFDMTRVDWAARIIGALTNGYVVDVVVSKKFEQQTGLTEESPLADKIKALKGKKIGMTGAGSGTEALLIYLFQQQGMDVQKDAHLVTMGSNNAAALSALSKNTVDALSFFSPIGQTAEAKGIGNIFISPDNGDVPALKGDVHGIFYTRQTTIDAKPKAVEGFIRAVAQAENYIQTNPDKAKGLLTKYLKQGNEVSSSVYAATSPVWAKDPQISTSAYEVASKFHVDAGLISITPRYGDMVATNTINAALSS
jgi:NitT/TauT family transport system substrate-binding protein